MGHYYTSTHQLLVSKHVRNLSTGNIDGEFDPRMCLDGEGNRQETDKSIDTFCVSGWRSSSRSLPPADGGGKVSAVAKIAETPRRVTPTTCFNTWAVERVQPLTRTKEPQIMIITEARYQFKAHKSVS